MDNFFKTFGEAGEADELVVGQKFAEGGQAEVYEAQIVWQNPVWRGTVVKSRVRSVRKVFKEGTFLRRLQSQWPQGLLQFDVEKAELPKLNIPLPSRRYICDLVCGT